MDFTFPYMSKRVIFCVEQNDIGIKLSGSFDIATTVSVYTAQKIPKFCKSRKKGHIS